MTDFPWYVCEVDCICEERQPVVARKWNDGRQHRENGQKQYVGRKYSTRSTKVKTRKRNCIRPTILAQQKQRNQESADNKENVNADKAENSCCSSAAREDEMVHGDCQDRDAAQGVQRWNRAVPCPARHTLVWAGLHLEVLRHSM